MTKIYAVLDASAMESYARGHIHVGELIAEVPDELKPFLGIPAAALAEAYVRSVGDDLRRAKLDVLATSDASVVFGLDLPEARELGTFANTADGDLARLHAAWVATSCKAFFVTTEPKKAVGLVNDDAIFDVPAEDH